MTQLTDKEEIQKLRIYKSNARKAYKRLQRSYDLHTLQMEKARLNYERMFQNELKRYQEAIDFVLAHPGLSAEECRRVSHAETMKRIRERWKEK